MKQPKSLDNSAPYASDASLEWPDRRGNLKDYALFEGVTWRRILAFCVDFVILSLTCTVLIIIILFSFGLFSALWALTPFIPVAYHSCMIGGSQSATCGMQVMGIKIRSSDGAKPSLLQAFVMTSLFYLSLTSLTPMVLIIALFNDRGRCLHDILSGTTVVLTNPDL